MSVPAFFASLRRFLHQESRASRRCHSVRRQGAVRRRPLLELLEERAVPATISWINAAGGAWNVPDNWDTHTVPGAADDVVIRDFSPDITITHATGTDSIRSLVSQEAVVLSGGSLSIGASGATSTINGSFTLSGGLVEFKGTSSITGPLSIAANSTLRALGSNAGDAVLTVAKGFTNNGTIELTSQDASRAATLTVSSETLTNAAGANLRALLGTGGARTLNAQLDNRGTLSVAQDLGLTNTGHTFNNSGTIDIANSRTLTINGGTFNPQPGTVTGPGTLALSSAIANLSSAYSNAVTGLTLSTSIVNGPGTLTNALGRTLPLINSTVNAPLVNQGTLITQATSALTGSVTNAGGSILRVLGTGTADGMLTVGTGFTNNGTIELTSTDPNGDATLIVSTGILTNAVGANLNVLAGSGGLRTLTAQVDNQGSFSVGANLTFGTTGRASTNSGTLTIASGHKLTTDAAFTNAGTLSLGSGNAFTDNTRFTQTAGTLTGSGNLFVEGLLVWSGGTMSGSGQTHADGGISIRGAADKFLIDRTLYNGDAGDWTDSGNFVLSDGATFINEKGSVFDIQNDAVLGSGSGDTPTVTNAGTFLKSAGTGTTSVSGAVTFSNNNSTGTVEVRTGTLFLQGEFSNFADRTLTGGTYVVASILKFASADIVTNAATIVLDGPASQIVDHAGRNALAHFAINAGTGSFSIQNGRNFTTAATGTFTNAGFLDMEDGCTFTIAGNFTNFAGNTLTGGTFDIDAGATLKFNGADIVTNAANIVLDGMAAQIVNQMDANALANFATNTAAGSFTIQNGENFTTSASLAFSNAGTLGVGGTSTFTVGGTFTNFANQTLTGGTYLVTGVLKFANADIVTNAATILLDGTASQILSLTNVNALTNFATNTAAGNFAIQNGRNFTTAATGSFTNAGTLTVGAGSTFTIAGSFTNFAGTTLTEGTYVIGGTLKFNGADIVTNAATIVLDGTASQIVNQSNANALANFATNTATGRFTIQNSRNFSAAGPFTNAGTLVTGTRSTFTARSTYTQTAGSLSGSGTLTVAGLLTWTGGSMSSSGQTQAQGGLVLSGSADKILSLRTFVNSATATWMDTGNFVLGGNATFTNQASATFDIQNDAILGYGSGGSPTFNNIGTFRKSAGTGTTILGGSLIFTNSGTVDVRTGTLFLQGQFTNFADQTLTNGTYLIGGTLKFVSADIATNAGNIVLDGPSAQIVNQVDGDALTNFATNAAAGRFTIQKGRNFTTAATLTFANAGTLNVGAGSTFTVGGGFSNFANGTLTDGTYMVGGTFQFNGANIVTNAATLVLDGPNSQVVNETNGNGLANFATNGAVGRFTIQNGRTLTTTGDFTNAGSVTIGSMSTFTVTGRYTQSAGSTTLSGGTLSAHSGANAGTVDIQGGLLAGSGTIDANLMNAGQVNPGGTGAIGVLKVSGNYTQTATGILNIELAGRTAGTQYDQLIVAGVASLGGTVNVRLINNYLPNLGDSFQVLLFGSRSGDFTTPTDLDLGSGRSLRRTFDATSMTLTRRT